MFIAGVTLTLISLVLLLFCELKQSRLGKKGLKTYIITGCGYLVLGIGIFLIAFWSNSDGSMLKRLLGLFLCIAGATAILAGALYLFQVLMEKMEASDVKECDLSNIEYKESKFSVTVKGKTADNKTEEFTFSGPDKTYIMKRKRFIKELKIRYCLPLYRISGLRIVKKEQ